MFWFYLNLLSVFQIFQEAVGRSVIPILAWGPLLWPLRARMGDNRLSHERRRQQTTPVAGPEQIHGYPWQAGKKALAAFFWPGRR